MCKKCHCEFPESIIIDGVRYSLNRRTNCLNCFPYKTRLNKNSNKNGPDAIRNVPHEQFSNIIKTSKSRSEVFRKLNATMSGSTFDIINKRILNENIDISHFKTFGENGRPKYDLESILVIDSKYTNTDFLKKRLVKERIFKYECSKCKLSDVWMDEPIILQLDHINGNKRDNRLCNLRLLCPNCHSQTKNFSGRNYKATI